MIVKIKGTCVKLTNLYVEYVICELGHSLKKIKLFY